ncbi:MAG: SIR2 family protein [Candidatus Acidiferrales bacterium]
MRTFIFGAGASVHAGYPLATDLWQFMERWARTTFPAGNYFRDAVDTMNAKFDVSKSFELVLTDLDGRIESSLRATPATPEDNIEKHVLIQLREAVKRMIPQYFNSLRSRPAELYDIFAADVLAPGDVVITFNYDLALDRALKRSDKWSIGDGYGFAVNIIPFGDSPCKLFKLHGSANWRGELFQGMRGFAQGNWEDLSLGQRPIIDPSEFEYLGYSDTSDPEGHNGIARIESLIMPTANKKFFNETSLGREWEAFWDSLWSQAGEALEISEEVHLIGYSIPEYDTRARELLATKINKRAAIRVCCHSGTANVVEALKCLGKTDVQAAPATTFEGWISRMRLA